jgi:hypothetical protein
MEAIKISESVPGWIAIKDLPKPLRMSYATLRRRIEQNITAWDLLLRESFSQKTQYVRTSGVLPLLNEMTNHRLINVVKFKVEFHEQPLGFVNKSQIRNQLRIPPKQYQKFLDGLFALDPELAQRYRGNSRRWDVGIDDAKRIVCAFCGDGVEVEIIT